ncbi:lipid A export permease/ATP-binding protein MsbA [Arenimonas caeni]|uniref:Lipid A export permease/ATP-binding protein MsbA n=1 Tax=Arenimonas caeni TaxID=2058085 RepID=A0A2P6MBA7_9GAMM|nr:lipid A export permease/ATP-binding protein MsbA [Arenimonas caeni]MDY0022745.1 lipid A export permease/ATP-binding protein MsbA [Arenimonas caeni]PRH83264.1 lipid A export permease/ATP-binding protein MsbA [Arenimonas caeni]
MSTETAAWTVYRRLLARARRYWVLLTAAALGMVFEAGAAAAFTWMMKPMVDETFVAQNADMRLSIPLAIIALFVLRGVATFATDFGMARTGRSVVRDLRQDILSKYLRLPSARFDREAVPAMVSRLNYDTEQVTQASSDALKVILTDTLTIIALLGVMLWYSPRVTLVMLVLAPLIAGISTVVGRRYRRINRGIQDGVASMAQVAEQALSAQQEVKIYGAQDSEQARYRSLIDRNLGLGVKVEATRALASSVVQVLAATGLAVILLVAGHEAAQGRMTAGSFVALLTAMMAMLPSLKRITNVQSLVQRGVAAADRLFAILDEPDEADTGTRPLQRARGEIGFRDVSVTYPGQERAALEGISFTAAPGTVTAIVGRSGSGKSTLIRLLPRFYEASAGQVLLDGHPVGDYRLADLRQQVAMVGQRVMLFDDTVEANIAYGTQAGADPARVRAAAAAANALEFIERLPGGMQARIGENGGLLSGGQRQRLAIARAILKDAPILILDEATAALDTESERLVQDALERLIPDRTTLVIAHRLSTVEHADQVLVLDNGRLVEQGTHAQLLARGGLYAHLHRMQFREPEAG